ncbi:hypothetical protein [Streptomyces sp. NBC_01506]|uniref:hypothetical protein n=1 Tax=Streptomyces sp. NBC_01506 TaxID=2903887 RepID=UPI00386ACCF7
MEITFSGGGDGPLVTMERAGRSLELAWPRGVPAPELAGDTATYRDILPAVDLRLGAMPDGFTQLLVVKTQEAATNPELTELRLKLAAEPGEEEPGAGESGRLAPVEVDVAQDGRELVLTPDPSLLNGSDTVYPVFIDPQRLGVLQAVRHETAVLPATDLVVRRQVHPVRGIRCA